MQLATADEIADRPPDKMLVLAAVLAVERGFDRLR